MALGVIHIIKWLQSECVYFSGTCANESVVNALLDLRSASSNAVLLC